ncbi:MAG: hypothetical protein IT280_11035 [Ignavibacteria bacterium]|nr:hypothetical protein [Ignavibacteria bacterium]
MKVAFLITCAVLVLINANISFSTDKNSDRLLKLIEKQKSRLKLSSDALENPRNASNMLSHLSFSDFNSPNLYKIVRDGKANKQAFHMETGIGLSKVDSTNYYLLALKPSYETGAKNWALNIGIDAPLRYRTSKVAFRSQDYESFTQILSTLNTSYAYLLNSKSFSLVFNGGFSQINSATLGKGSIMYGYNNSPSYENRRNGISLDVAYNVSGYLNDNAATAKLFLSDVTSGGIFGLGFEGSPLKVFGGKKGKLDLPVLKDFNVGFNLASDFNKNAGITKVLYDTDTTGGVTHYYQKGFVDAGAISLVNMYGEMVLFGEKTFSTYVYGEYSKIVKFGSDASAGIDLVARTEDNKNYFSLTFQRRYQQGKYLPTYFNGLYENDRYQLISSSDNLTRPQLFSKASMLDTVQELKGSTFFSVYGMFMKSFVAYATYQKIDKGDLGGELYIVASLPNIGDKFSIYAGYYKRRIKGTSELFKFNENAYFFGQASYILSDMIVLSLSYQQTFAAVRDAKNNVIGYAAQKRFTPQVNFIWPIGR